MKKYYIAFVLLCSINYNCVSSLPRTILPTTIIQAEGSGGYSLYSIQEIASNKENNLTEDDVVQLYNKILTCDNIQLRGNNIEESMLLSLKLELKHHLQAYFTMRKIKKTTIPKDIHKMTLFGKHDLEKITTDNDQNWIAVADTDYHEKLSLYLNQDNRQLGQFIIPNQAHTQILAKNNTTTKTSHRHNPFMVVAQKINGQIIALDQVICAHPQPRIYNFQPPYLLDYESRKYYETLTSSINIASVDICDEINVTSLHDQPHVIFPHAYDDSGYTPLGPQKNGIVTQICINGKKKSLDNLPWTTKLALHMPWIQTIFAGTSACATATAIYYQADPKITQPLICATALLTTSAIVEHCDAYQARSRFHTKTAQSNNPEYLEKLKVIPGALDYKRTQELAQGYGIAAAIMRYSHSDSHQKKAQLQPEIAKMSQTYNPRNMNMKAIFRR